MLWVRTTWGYSAKADFMSYLKNNICYSIITVRTKFVNNCFKVSITSSFDWTVHIYCILFCRVVRFNSASFSHYESSFRRFATTFLKFFFCSLNTVPSLLNSYIDISSFFYLKHAILSLSLSLLFSLRNFWYNVMATPKCSQSEYENQKRL